MVEVSDTPDQPVLPATALPRRQTALTMLLGAVILLGGIAMGLGAAMLWLKPNGPPPHIRRDRSAAALAAEIAETCDLTDQQSEKVRQIVAKRLDALRDIRQDMSQQVLAQHAKLRQEMKDVLTPEQFERWSKRLDRVQERWRLRRDRRRGGRFGPGKRGGRRGGGRFPPEGRPDRIPRGPGDVFGRFDSDSDGLLRQDEVPPRLWPGISSADADANGAVSQQEWAQSRPAQGSP